jgi:phosphatidylglycerophosphatase C
VEASTQPATRRLAIFDLDGTLTRQDTFFPFVLGLLLRHPARWPRVALLLIPALGYLFRRLDRGGLKGAILHCLFSGMSRDAVSTRAKQYAADVVPARMFAEAVSAFRAHLASGDHVVLLSASPDLYVPEIGHLLGAHEVICSEVRWSEDRLDGRLSGPNRRDHEKARVLASLRVRMPGLPAIAYGNSKVDLIHMSLCEQAVYVNPEPSLAAQLAQRGLRCVDWR